MASIFVAKNSFIWNDNGTPRLVPAGHRVREGHPVISGREAFFIEEPAPDLEWPTEGEDKTPIRRGPGRPKKN